MVIEQVFHILVVDDELIVREAIEQILSLKGYTIHLCDSASAALAILETRHVDMIITDYNMPGMKGDELLSTVHKKYPDIIRVMVSGYADVDIVISCLNSGDIQRFFPKPFYATELAETVRNLLKIPLEFKGAPSTERKILLVEDSKYCRNFLKRALDPDYIVLHSEDGIQAINMAKATTPDLVVTGIKLFGVNGFNLVKFLRMGLGLTCPIIIWEYPKFVDERAWKTLREEVDAILDKDMEQYDELIEKIGDLVVRAD